MITPVNEEHMWNMKTWNFLIQKFWSVLFCMKMCRVFDKLSMRFVVVRKQGRMEVMSKNAFIWRQIRLFGYCLQTISDIREMCIKISRLRGIPLVILVGSVK